MIDECIWETKTQNVNLKNENVLHNHIHLLESKRRKRIRDAYNELEYGYKKRREE